MSVKRTGRRFNRFVIRLLNFLTYNETVKNIDFILTIFVLVVWLIDMLLIKIPFLFGISNVIWCFIVINFCVGSYWEAYNDKRHIKDLQTEVEDIKLNNWTNTSNLEEGLAVLAHDIWCADVRYETNNAEVQHKTNMSFEELTPEEQDVNRTKAARIMKVVKSYV